MLEKQWDLCWDFGRETVTSQSQALPRGGLQGLWAAPEAAQHKLPAQHTGLLVVTTPATTQQLQQRNKQQ